MATPYDDIEFKEEDIGSEKWIEVAQWCNNYGIQDNKGYYIKKDENTKIYKVVEYEVPDTSTEELIQEYKGFLRDTDNYAIRLASGEAQESDYSSTYDCTFKEIMEKRAEAREKIKELSDDE